MEFEKGKVKLLERNGKKFIYVVTVLTSINSSGDHEESVELFELPEREKEYICSDCGKFIKREDYRLCYGCIQKVREQKEATQDGTTDGIPPKPKDLGILPTII